MDICPRCKEKLFLPFEINNCPYCDFNLNKSDDIFVSKNPFIDEDTSKIDIKEGHVFSSNFIVEEFIHYSYPFTFYRVSKNSKNYMLQLSKFDKEMDEGIFNDLKDNLYFKIYKKGINNKIAYMVTDFFQFNTLYSDLNSTTKLPLDYLINFMLFSINLHEKSHDIHMFINPCNVISLGDNQFTLINCNYLKLFANFLKPCYFLTNTYDYMAPEIKTGASIITKKCDLYSIAKIWEKLLSINFLEDIKIFQSLKKELTPFIDKMLEKDFKDREIDSKALKKILNSILFLESENSIKEIKEKKISLNEESEPEVIEIDEVEIDENEEEDIENIEKYSSVEINENEEEDIENIKYPAVSNELENDYSSESTMIIHVDDIFLDEVKEEEIKKAPLEEEITIVDLEDSEEITPPPVLKPPKIDNKEEKIISKLKKDLNKNPLNKDKMTIMYNYYLSKEEFDKAFVISNILNFLNSPVENNLSVKEWKPEKKLLTNIDESLFIKNELYSGTSGILLALENFLNKKEKIITPINHNTNNFIPITKDGNGEIIQNILDLLSITDIRIGIIAKNIIANNKNLSTIIYRKKDFRYIGIKKELFDSLDETFLKIIISKLICLTHPDIILNFMYDVESIEEIFYGVMKFTIPFVRNAHDSKISNVVLNELQAMKFNSELHKTELINMVKVMNEHFSQRKQQPDFRASLKNIEITSDRFALVISNDLIATLKSFLDYKDISLILNPKERMKELLRYALSEEYFKLRKTLNQSI